MIWLIVAVAVFAFLIYSFWYESPKRRDAKKLQQLSEYLTKQMEQEGLGTWPVSLFSDPEQMKRVGRALHSQKMKIVSFDSQTKEYEVMGEHGEVYTIQHGQCSCMDFRTRGLPCKHMYFVGINIEE